MIAREETVDWLGCSEIEFASRDGRDFCALAGTEYHPDIIVDAYLEGESLKTIARRFEGWTPERVRIVLDFAVNQQPLLFAARLPERFDWSGCEDVEQVPGRCGGVPVLKNTRMHADGVISIFKVGFPKLAVAESFSLDVEQVCAVVAHWKTKIGWSAEAQRQALSLVFPPVLKFAKAMLEPSGCAHIEERALRKIFAYLIQDLARTLLVTRTSPARRTQIVDRHRRLYDRVAPRAASATKLREEVNTIGGKDLMRGTELQKEPGCTCKQVIRDTLDCLALTPKYNSNH